MDPENRAFDVKGCPRCGEDHGARNFFRRTDRSQNTATSGLEVHPVWWSLCPLTGDTLALVIDRDGDEVAAAID